MRRTRIRALLAPLAALSLAACAHAPGAAERLDDRGAPLDGATAPARPERVLVTGSHIPLRVDRARGLPATFSPVTILTRDELLRSAAPGQLGAALYRLDPSLGP